MGNGYTVYYGQELDEINLGSGDSMWISSGGTASSTTVNDWGYLYVSSGGTAINTTVNDSGYLYVSSGGTANSTMLYEGAVFYVYNGGTANSVTINYDATLCVLSGGIANSVTVNSGGDLYVSSGATATNIVWTPCMGNVGIADGAYVTFASQYSGVYYGSDNELLSHASVMNARTVSSYNCSMYVMSGGTANNTTVDWGSVYVYSGGTAINTTVNNWGGMRVSGGGTANSTTVNSGGVLCVASGGTANSTTVNSWGGLYVSSGGTANNTTVNYGGSLDVSSGGTANSITVNENGYMYVFSGGTATNIVWTPCVGYIGIDDGAYATYASKYSGVYYGSDNQLLSNATEMENKTVGYGSMYVMSGGVANSTTINDRGYMYVFSGGTANSTTVNSGGLYVSSGGTANSTTVNSGGDLCVASGGTANNTTVNSDGKLYVSSGGTANRIVENGGYVGVEYGANVTFVANSFYGLVLSDTSATVHSGTTANSTMVNDWGYLYVSSGGTANSITVNENGYMYVFSGGTATNIVWTPCVGYIGIDDGAYATYASKYSGVYYGSDERLLSHATVMNDRTLSGYVSMYVMSGGTANSTTVNSGGHLYISSGGTANNTTVNAYGYLYISSGGTANNTTVDYDGDLCVASGGTANGTTVNDWGYLYVASGGTATNIVWTPCIGTVRAEDGAKVTFASKLSGVYYGSGDRLLSHATEMENKTVGYGSMYVMSGGTANSTTVNSGGDLCVASGGMANNTTVNYGGSLDVSSGGVANNVTINNSESYIFSGGTANGVIVNEDGWLDIESGGTANGVIVNEDGWLDIESGGTANDVTVTSGGSLRICEVGKLTGQTSISNGAYVSASKGTVLDFDISNLAPGAAARINNLSLISGWKESVYTLTVNGNQANGTYKLADGAAGFNKTISVVNTSGSKLGSLSVGSSVTVSGKTYQLNLSGGSLAVAVSGKTIIDNTAPTVSNVKANITSATNKDVTVTATFSDNESVASSLYRIGTSGDWKSYSNGVTVSKNSTVYFKAVDTSGNESTVVSYKVTNIDKTAPAKPTAKANITSVTSQAVVVTASFSSDTGTKQYSLDGTKWTAYTSGVTFKKNGTVYFRGIDAVGNISEITTYRVSNITSFTTVSGVVVRDRTVTVPYAYVYIKTTVDDDGELYIASGGTANSTTVLNYGYVEVSSGGVANGVTVKSGGGLDVESGGTATNVSWTPCVGWVNWEDGAKVTFASALTGVYLGYGNKLVSHTGTISSKTLVEHEDEGPYEDEDYYGETMYVMSGGKANNITLRDESTLEVWSGGVASGIAFKDASMVFVCNGGVVKNAQGNGDIEVWSGGVVSSLTMKDDDGGNLDIFRGGIVSGLTIYGLGDDSYYGYSKYNLRSGGKVTGRTRIYSSAVLTVQGGAIIDFDLTIMSPGDAVLMNNLSALYEPEWDWDKNGNSVPNSGAVYTLTVNGNQANGTYKLADGAAGFNKTISVVNTSGSKLGSLSVGSSVTVSGKTYQLNLSGGSLAVAVSGKSSGGGSTTVDKTKPTVSNVKANITAATNKNVTVTATFSDNVSVASRLYRIGTSGDWKSYSNGVTVSKNSTVYFKAVDPSGNESKVVSYKVTNIDKTAPAKPTSVKANISKTTNQTVTVTASFSKDSSKKQYSLDNKSWSTYSNGVKLTKNGTVYFRGIDAAGNISPVVSYKVTNIDTTAPTKPTAKANITKATNQAVTVTASFSSDSAKKQYSLNNKSWSNYSNGVKLTKNGTVYFRGIDAAGNISPVVSYKVTNIDTTAPAKPTAKANTTAATNQAVTVTATFSKDSDKKQYSLDNKKWSNYSNGVKVTKNGTVYFRGLDAAGNISPVVSYKVSNITKSSASTSSGNNNTIVSGLVLKNKSATVSQAYTYDKTTVNSDGLLNVSSGGTATNTTLVSGGAMYVEKGGRANSTTVNSWGNLTINSGGVANAASVKGNGRIYVEAGGKATNVTVEKKGDLFVASGGTATNIKWTPTIGYVWVESGAKATYASALSGVYYGNGTKLYTHAQSISSKKLEDEQVIEVMSGGTAINTTLYGFGEISIRSGGTAINTTAKNMSYFNIYSGGKITGRTRIDGNAMIRVEPGAIVDFDLRKTSAGAAALVNCSLDSFTGAVFTLTVDGKQTNGTYKLAEDSYWFNETISVVNASGTKLGTLTVGQSTVINGISYTLKLISETLSVTVTKTVSNQDGLSCPGVASFGGNADSVAIAPSEQAADFNGIGAEWEMLATADFNADGKDDTLWRNSFIGDDGSWCSAYCTKLADQPTEETDWRMVGVTDAAEWNFLGSGDFDFDGAADIAMIGNDGVVGIWGVQDGGLSSWSILSSVTPEWSFSGIADFNADGTDDIAWCNTETGLSGFWQIENKELASWQTLATFS